MTDDPNAAGIWLNGRIPVLYKPAWPDRLLVRLPSAPLFHDTRLYLRGRNGRLASWLARYGAWELPRSRFDELARLLLARYRKLYIIQIWREMQKCAPACWEAQGMDCECSCMGRNHGSGQALNHVIGETELDHTLAGCFRTRGGHDRANDATSAGGAGDR